jgi:hypothetical protein
MKTSSALTVDFVSDAFVRPVAIFNEELLLIGLLIQPKRG